MAAREVPGQARPGGVPGWLAVAGALAVLLATAVFLQRTAARAGALQWDLRVYLAAARAARAGLDPYVSANLAHVTGRPEALPFLYPPVAILPFLALGSLAPPLPFQLWIALKAGIALGIVAWWQRGFAPAAGALAVAALALFGSNASLVADLRSGNVGLIEAGLLWWAFALWLRGRTVPFAALVVAAAAFKLAPAVFLALLLVPLPGRPARPHAFLGALAALALVVLAPFAVGPAAHWRGALGALAAPFPVGEANPSAFALALSLARGRVAQPALVAGVAWLAWCALVAVASLPALRRLRSAGDAKGMVAAAVALDLLLSPRPMAYGFALGGGAMAWLVARSGRTWLERGGLTLLLCAQGLLALRGEPWTGTLAAHGALFAWAALWALFLVRGTRAPRRVDARPTAHGIFAGLARKR